MKIGFIGLGNMGAPMVKRLVASGHDITGYDVMESAMAALSEVKMNFSNNILTAAREKEVVITMLPNGKVLKAFIFSKDIFIVEALACLTTLFIAS